MLKVLKINLFILFGINALLLLTADLLTVAMGLMVVIIVQFLANIGFGVYYFIRKETENGKWFLLGGLLVLIIGMGTCFANSYILKEVFGLKSAL